MSIYFSGDSPLPSATSTPRAHHHLNENQDSPNDSTVPRTPCIDKSDFSTNDQSVPRTPVPFLSQSPHTSLAGRRADLATPRRYSFPLTPIQRAPDSAESSPAVSDQCVPSVPQRTPRLLDLVDSGCGLSTPNFITLNTLDSTPSPQPYFGESANAFQGRNRAAPEFSRLASSSRRRLSLGWERTRCSEGLDSSPLAVHEAQGLSVRRRSLDESHKFRPTTESRIVFASSSDTHDTVSHIEHNSSNCQGFDMNNAISSRNRTESNRGTVPKCRNVSINISTKNTRKYNETSKNVVEKRTSKIHSGRNSNKLLVSSLKQAPLNAAGDAPQANYFGTASHSFDTSPPTNPSPGPCETLLEALDHIGENGLSVQFESPQPTTGVPSASVSMVNSVCRREDVAKQRHRLRMESSTCQRKDEGGSQIDLFAGSDVFA